MYRGGDIDFPYQKCGLKYNKDTHIVNYIIDTIPKLSNIKITNIIKLITSPNFVNR